MRSKINERCDEDAGGDSELVRAHDGSAKLSAPGISLISLPARGPRQGLRLVDGHSDRESADTEAGDETADGDLLPAREGHNLNDDSAEVSSWASSTR